MSTDRQATLKLLLRAIALSVGDFALLLARCNSIEVRDRLVADLKAQLGDGLYDRHVIDADGVVNLVDILDEVGEGTQVISVTGLEASPHLHDILALANNAREEFRKRFKFPLVLWVTDEVEAELRRRSPDLASWAAPPFDFALDRAELQAMLERETTDVLDWAFAREGKRGIGQELQWAWQEWQRLEENRSPELAAKVALAFGIEAGSGAAAREHLENCLAQVNTGSLAAAARYRLGLWWQLRGKQERVNFVDYCDRAREQLQSAWQEPEGKQASVALALGEILLALALPETGDAPQSQTRWQALANFANELVILPDWAAGLRAEVAIARQDWQVAKTDAEKALQGQERQGFYLLSLGRSLIGINQAKEAIAPLEQAKALVLPEVDPDLHIRILQALHRAYTAVGNYRDAFTVKCDRESVETSYGFRAFIGAGRLQPQRRVGAIGEDATEEIAASGRQADIEALVDRVKRSDCRLTVVHGPSGVGKSSLLQSGLVPALRKVIHNSRSVQPVVIEHYEDWQGELANKIKVSDELTDKSVNSSDTLISQLHDRDRQNLITVLIFDQFEEFFFKHTDVPDRRKLYDFLRECLNVPYVWVILSLREDYIHYLLECDRLANIELINNDILNKNVRYYLGNFSKERAQAVIKELTERSPYRLEETLVDRLVADLAAEFGEVRPIELQVVGAQMLQGDDKILKLSAYEAIGSKPKQALVERWLTQVIRDCGKENEELAQRVLYALTEEPEKRPVKTKAELQRDVRLLTPTLPTEEREFSVQGDLDFVLSVPIGSGLAFEIPAMPEACYQLIHDYLVPPIRQQFGVRLTKQLEEERKKRKEVEENLRKRTQWLLQGSLIATVVFAILGGAAFLFALQANEQKSIAEGQAFNAQSQTDNIIWNKLMDDQAFSLEAQIATLEKAKEWKNKLNKLYSDTRLELLVTLHRAANINYSRPTSMILTERKTFTRIAFSPDGKSFLTSSQDGKVKLWSLDGRLIKEIKRQIEYSITSLDFAPDSKSFLTGSQDGTVKLWSLDGKLLRSFKAHQNSIVNIVFAPDGRSFLTSTQNEVVTIKLWNINGNLIQTFKDPQDKQYSVTSLAFAPDSKSFLTGSQDGTINLWSLEGRLLQNFKGLVSSVPELKFAPNGKSFLIRGDSSQDRSVKLLSLDGKLLQTFDEQQNSNLQSFNSVVYPSYTSNSIQRTTMSFAPNGQSLIIRSQYGDTQLWNIDGTLLQNFNLIRSQELNDLTPSQAIEQVIEIGYLTFTPDSKSILAWGSSYSGEILGLWGLDGGLRQTFEEKKNFIITSVAFSADSRSVLTGSSDGTAKLWNFDKKLLQTFDNQVSIDTVKFSPDGKMFLTGSRNGIAKLWSIDKGLIQTFKNETPITNISFSPNEQSVLLGGNSGIIKLWSLNGDLLQTFNHEQTLEFQPYYDYEVQSIVSSQGSKFFLDMDFSPDGKSILSIDQNRTVKLWSLDGQLLQTFKGEQQNSSAQTIYIEGNRRDNIVFSPDRKSMLTSRKDGQLQLWSLDGKLLKDFKEQQQDYVTSIAFAPDGKSFLAGGLEGSLMLWSLDGTLRQTFKGHEDIVDNVVFAPDGKSFVTISLNTAKLWSLDGKLIQTFNSYQDYVTSIAFSPVRREPTQVIGQTVLTGSGDHTAKLWSFDGELLKTFKGHQDSVTSVAFAPDGKSIATGSGDRTINLWSLDGDRLLKNFRGHQSKITSIVFSPNGKTMLTGSEDKTAKLWNLDGQLLKTFQGHTAYVTSVAFAPDGKSVLTGNWDKTAKLWNLDGRLIQTFKGHQDSVTSVAFAPDSKKVLTGSDDASVKLWNIEGKVLQTFQGHQSQVTSVAFAPDGKSVLAGSRIEGTKLWILDGRLLYSFKQTERDSNYVYTITPNGLSSMANEKIISVAFAPDGNSSLTGSERRIAKLWDFELEHSLIKICSNLLDFTTGKTNPTIPEEKSELRERTRKVCEGILPPPK